MKVVVAIALAGLAVGPAFAQAGATVEIARTADGHPDFQGIWTSRWLTPVERPSTASGLVVDADVAAKMVSEILARAAHPSQLDPEIAYPEGDSLAVVRGEHRTSLVILPANGRLPFTSTGRAAMGKYVGGLDGPEIRMTTERCLGGVSWAPLQIRGASMLRQIVQTPQSLLIHSEAYSDLRIIGINGVSLPEAVKQAGGDSIARWEGDALVVETRNFDPETSTHGIVTVMSPQAEISERFELASPDELVYRYTITDPAYYSEPWTAEYSLMRSDERIYEFACHEGNYAMSGMLAGARRAEQLAGKAP